MSLKSKITLPNKMWLMLQCKYQHFNAGVILVSAPSCYSPAKIMQYLKGKSSYRLQREYGKLLNKSYWGQHIWSRGYFCATVGAVTEEQIKKYIEQQDEEDSDIKVWDEKLESDLSEK